MPIANYDTDLLWLTAIAPEIDKSFQAVDSPAGLEHLIFYECTCCYRKLSFDVLSDYKRDKAFFAHALSCHVRQSAKRFAQLQELEAREKVHPQIKWRDKDKNFTLRKHAQGLVEGLMDAHTYAVRRDAQHQVQVDEMEKALAHYRQELQKPSLGSSVFEHQQLGSWDPGGHETSQDHLDALLYGIRSLEVAGFSLRITSWATHGVGTCDLEATTSVKEFSEKKLRSLVREKIEHDGVVYQVASCTYRVRGDDPLIVDLTLKLQRLGAALA